ncbi:MAG: hypothetical protein IPO47_19665 [Bacteroidetes bacterium]|nr:hypothetical protein [Bacteroidota bacterium]
MLKLIEAFMLYKRFFKIYIIFVVVMSAAVNIGIKGTAIVILFGMLQSYACSALCTFNLYSCCNTVDEVHSCCSNELTPVASKSNPSGDCQDKHLEFSLSTGQFFSIAITDIAKVFSSESDLNKWLQTQLQMDFLTLKLNLTVKFTPVIAPLLQKREFQC